ncbi:MAG: sensor histidine kinase [Thermoleophilia bacterium]
MERFLGSDRALSWLALGLAAIGVAITLLNGAGDAAWLVCAAAAPFAVRVPAPAVPAWAALVVTTALVVVANRDGEAEGAFFLPIIAVLPVVVTDRNRARALAAGGLAFVAPIATWLLAGQDGRDWTWSFWSMGALLMIVFGAVVNRQRTLTAQLLEARRRLAEREVADERRRIAREVHDLVGHSLSVVLLHLTGARHLLRRDADEAERALTEAERAGRESLAEIRRTVGLLRDPQEPPTAPAPGVGDIPGLVGEYRRGGLEVDLTMRGPTDGVGGVTGLTLYRLAQESLANVARHAPGGRAAVDVRVAGGRASIEVSNSVDGRAPARRPGGVGIVGMRERALAIGGDLTAGPTSSGWAVRAWLPCADDGEAP